MSKASMNELVDAVKAYPGITKSDLANASGDAMRARHEIAKLVKDKRLASVKGSSRSAMLYLPDDVPRVKFARDFLDNAEIDPVTYEYVGEYAEENETLFQTARIR